MMSTVSLNNWKSKRLKVKRLDNIRVGSKKTSQDESKAPPKIYNELQCEKKLSLTRHVKQAAELAPSESDQILKTSTVSLNSKPLMEIIEAKAELKLAPEVDLSKNKVLQKG